MSDKYDYAQEDKLAMQEVWLAEAGLTRDDFHGVISVEDSPFSGRVIVTAKASFEAHPIEKREPLNLVAVLHESGSSRFIFNRVESEVTA